MGVEEEETVVIPPTSNGSSSARMSSNAEAGITLPKKKSGIFGASSNLVNSIVGAGIIGLPYAFRQSGLVAGVLLLALVGWLTDKSLRIIVELATFHPKLRTRGVMTYEDLMAYPFGRFGSAFILINMFILAYGAMIAYLLIIKDTVPTVLGLGNSFVERELVVVATSLIVIVPLSVQRDMASLALTSLLSVTADIVLVGFVAAYAPIPSAVSSAGGFGQVLTRDWINPTIFVGLGILSTAMACQHSAFIVSGSLANKTSSRWASVTFRSITLSTILSAVMGITGYLGFLELTMGDVLNNFPEKSVESNAARILLAITMFFTYPMELFVARHVIVKFMYNGDMDCPTDQNGRPIPTLGCLSRRTSVTLMIYLATLLPALVVRDIGPVLSITGSLGGSLLSYVAPGMVYLGVNGDEFLAYAANLVDSRRQRDERATGDIELPVVGDANQIMRTEEPPAYPTGRKPWWWCLILMPVWCSIAKSGAMTMRRRLETNDTAETPSQAEVEEIHPRSRDYWISIFFIVFGTIAAIAGLASNIWVQINDIFFSSH